MGVRKKKEGTILDNKWKHGKVKLILPPMPTGMQAFSGIKPLTFTLDLVVGPEIVLVIMEPKKEIRAFRGRDILSFFTKSGLVNTTLGPVFWLLFYLPEHITGQTVSYEHVVNIKDPENIRVFEQLAAQKYWHVIFVDQAGEVTNFAEFKNIYGLAEAINQAQEVCANMPVLNFPAARAEYERLYSVEDLLNL